ncbi:hypothetical protein [Methanolobus psychrotolerans]|uniref:hypothetical protein n=1 Tax=Methanolobus psychrotolerans TaxID=1874706 RepID=UPI000B9170EF|nr:hypothetical protein [Methanolobus psychrotolerans]
MELENEVLKKDTEMETMTNIENVTNIQLPLKDYLKFWISFATVVIVILILIASFSVKPL